MMCLRWNGIVLGMIVCVWLCMENFYLCRVKGTHVIEGCVDNLESRED